MLDNLMNGIISWNNIISCDIPSIDNQHKKIINTLNKLWMSLIHDENMSTIEEYADQLEKVIRVNFFTEEKYMKQYYYPHFKTHKEQHDNFFKIFNSLKRDLKSQGNTPELSEKVKKLAVEWFKLHVEKVDKSLGAYLNSIIYKTA